MAPHRCKHICKPLQAHPRPKFAKELPPLLPKQNYFLKFPSPLKIFKTATHSRHIKNKHNSTMTAKPLSDLTFTTRQTERQQVIE